MTSHPRADRDLDAVVVGAGVAGLYQLHLLRELGLRARCYDAAGDVGGTWWWHGYPGARLDTEGYLYQYLFSGTLYRDWGWSERFPAGYEVQRWLRFVADRLDLRRDIRLFTPILSAHWDSGRGRWTVRTEGGETVDARFVVSCAGSVVDPPVIEGQADFAGSLLHPSRWPEDGHDLAGRRVGVIGDGATGIQLVPTIVDRVGHLTVFAGAPRYLVPIANPMYGWRDRESYRARFPELRDTLPRTLTGFDDDGDGRADLDELYRDGSLRLWRASLADPCAAIAELVRERMRERLGDQRLIDVLVPTDDGFRARRVPLDTGYLEVFHRGDVDLVDVRTNPVARIRAEGLELADGTVRELDVIVLATGFDVGADALTRIDVRGRDGRSPTGEATLGLAWPGHPNLFTTAGPLTEVVNRAALLQHRAEWIARAIEDLRAVGGSVIEATGTGGTDLVGGLGGYRHRCATEAAAGYPSFTRT